jgi:ribosomal protein S18 acetylase RimI-like enzyme
LNKIEPLSKAHDRTSFDCGSEPLNVFLKQIARQHAERGISRTFVLVDDQAGVPRPILGFFSLSMSQVDPNSFFPEDAKKLPRVVFAVRLGRLAVAKGRQRQGLGRSLMVGALKKFQEIFERAGGIGLFVDAKDQDAKIYYEQFGFVSIPGKELELFLPVKSVQEILR